MKKITIFFLLAVSLAGSLQAQDTIHIRDIRLLNRYLVPEWPYAFPTYTIDSGKYQKGTIMPLKESFDQVKEQAWYMYTDDTLQVYGIAAGLIPHWRFYPDDYTYTGDTSCEFLYDYLRLYEAEPDSLRHIGEELLVHIRYTPVSYYIDLELVRSRYQVKFWPLVPMYDRYFSAPVTVADSFYVGRRCRPDHHEGKDLYLLQLADTLYHGRDHYAIYCDYVHTMLDWTGQRYDTIIVKGWKYDTLKRRDFIPFLFPILTPNPDAIPSGDTLTTGYYVLHSGNTVVIAPGDTLVISGDTLVNTGDTLVVNLGDTVVIGGSTLVLDVGDTLFVNPGDTLFVGPDGSIHVNPGGTIVVGSGSGDPGAGLRQTDMVSRYTSVAPNPATERATVLSSFGLERIEVYDSQGRQTLTLPATGYKAVLDTHAWPSGTYLLRIHTPLGTTTKKLLVQ